MPSKTANNKASVEGDQKRNQRKLPRLDEVPAAFATAPSNASGIPVSMRRIKPKSKFPRPITGTTAPA